MVENRFEKDAVVENVQEIINACEARWEANRSDCNRFVKAVGADLGVPIVAGNADAIINDLTTNWSSVARGRRS